MDKYEKLKTILKNSKNICVFTGAGISCPSGIPDFRSADGLYNREEKSGYSPEEIISHSFFMSRTKLFYEFYKSSMLYPHAKPNAAHIFFADLEKEGKNVTVVTQNVDGLHQQAGSSRVIELHGNANRNYCLKCKKSFSMEYICQSEGVPLCNSCGAVVRPDVVLYEEALPSESVFCALEAISQADTMIIVGTSLVVYPAASYVGYFKGENLILINKGSTAFNSAATLTFNEDVIKVIEALKK